MQMRPDATATSRQENVIYTRNETRKHVECRRLRGWFDAFARSAVSATDQLPSATITLILAPLWCHLPGVVANMRPARRIWISHLDEQGGKECVSMTSNQMIVSLLDNKLAATAFA